MSFFITLFTTLILSGTPELKESHLPEVIISDEGVELFCAEDVAFFKTAVFNDETETLAFSTTQDISVVQIFNEMGELEFQLPVMSNNVQMNKNLFGKGKFKLAFVLKGMSQVYFTKVIIK